ncbi:MAG: hypothetical protein HC929_00205 [Leptolyngbyaceae cyanobacterium SM2_5_2]|nr:hypothetical protein [Leptolyngbyaceae cyanobacterium SM2_5_2]
MSLGIKQGVAEASPPAVPPLPASVPPAIGPEETGIVGLTPGPVDDVGVGHLHPSNVTSLLGSNWRSSPILHASWLRSIALPIYIGPNGDHWGWLINGWLIPNGSGPIAVGRDATFSMVQADRGLYSFPVLEVRPDGWFRFQYTPAGSAWAHTAHLNVGALSLTIEPWEEQIQEAYQVEFRKHGLSQPLRSVPRGSGSLRSLVVPNSLIRPLEVQGDWVRVQVVQPVRGCTPLPGSTTDEGWMRWRDTRQTLLVWFSTEDGCE